jgi:serine/threonine-protein kinase RsbT
VAVLKTETIDVRSAEDVSFVRQKVRQSTIELGFTLIEQTKMITACSELARNMIQHGGGSGVATIEHLNAVPRRGLRVIFEDRGPGISDIQLALRDGYTTGGGLGMGLGGSKRLVNDFDIRSAPGEGTRVTITRWK